jgi:hypothetical protein
MPRKPPPPHPKGAPRTPGSGRKKGTPNRRTIELRELMAALLDDVEYQHRLRDDFRKRRVHPSTEVRVWEYIVGKPKETIEVSADVTMNEKLAEERELLRKLSLPELEALAAESQALVDKALAMAQGHGLKPAATTSYPAADHASIDEPAKRPTGTKATDGA